MFATTPSARESTGDEKNSANQNDDFDLELGWTDAMNDDENEDRKWLRSGLGNLSIKKQAQRQIFWLKI